MKEVLINLQTAKLLRRKQFNKPVTNYFRLFNQDFIEEECSEFLVNSIAITEKDEQYARPSQDLVEQWLRTIFSIHVWVEFAPSVYTSAGKEHPAYFIGRGYVTRTNRTIKSCPCSTHEEAREDILQEALKQIK